VGGGGGVWCWGGGRGGGGGGGAVSRRNPGSSWCGFLGSCGGAFLGGLVRLSRSLLCLFALAPASMLLVCPVGGYANH